MKNIYTTLANVEKKPAMFLGNNNGVKALNHFVTGFMVGGGYLYDKKLNYPNFSLFTDWLGGLWKTNYEKSAMNWSWLLLEKYKDDKKALEKFFYYLRKFKSANNEVVIIRLTKANIQYAIDRNEKHLWCKVGNTSKLYYTHLKKIDRIILFKLLPSNTQFSLLVDKKGKLMDSRNTDMTNRILRNQIETQFGISVNKYKVVTSAHGNKILKQYKVI